MFHARNCMHEKNETGVSVQTIEARVDNLSAFLQNVSSNTEISAPWQVLKRRQISFQRPAETATASVASQQAGIAMISP